jgi:hypothetical protein
MENVKENALINAVSRTFNELCFIDISRVDEPFNGKWNISHVIYTDVVMPDRMKIALFLPLQLKELIAENIFCRELKELSSDEIDDCQLEILNVITGNFLRDLYEGKKEYKFDLPVILFDEKRLNLSDSKYDCYLFDADDIIFKIEIYAIK